MAKFITIIERLAQQLANERARREAAERAAASKIGPDWREALPYESTLESFKH